MTGAELARGLVAYETESRMASSTRDRVAGTPARVGRARCSQCRACAGGDVLHRGGTGHGATYISLGTRGLVGLELDTPVLTEAARAANFTHEGGVGGGSQNALLCQALADRTGLPVVAGPVEATALGNVLVQGRAAGAFRGGLDDLRALVARTQDLRTHEPRSRAWKDVVS